MKHSFRNLQPLRLAIATALAAVTAGASSEDLTQLDLTALMDMNVTLVTAQKRVENADHVPISMIVLKADAARQYSLDSTSDLQTVAPGLTTSNQFDYMVPFIRGIGTDSIVTIEPSVSVYVDGVYLAQRSETLIDLADVEQIEILKGPQGTLYGRNSTGGAIKITTRAPSDALQADARVTTGNFDLRDGYAFIGGPLNEHIRASLSGHVRQKDAFYENVLGTEEPRAEDAHAFNGRLQVDLAPGLNAELLLKYQHREDGTIHPTALHGNSIPALLGYAVSTEPFKSASDLASNPNRMTSKNAALKLDWDAPVVHVQSTTAYDRVRYRGAYDFDASAAPLLTLYNSTPSHAFTQELQFSPLTAPSRVDWVAGLFYIRNTSWLDPVSLRGVTPGLEPFVRQLSSSVKTDAFAGFGDVTFGGPEGFALTTGLRFSHERKRVVDSTLTLQGFEFANPDRSHDWDNVSYRLVAKYNTQRSLWYAKTETAFKTGAYGVFSASEREPPTPAEHITAYEAGVKHGLRALPVHLAAAAFYNDYHDQQLQLFDPSGQSALYVAAPKAATRGVDASAAWQASKHWQVNAGVEWLKATYRDFTTRGVLVPNPLGGNVSVATMDLSGKHLLRAPELTANLGMTFEYPLAAGTLFSSANLYRSSRFYFDAANVDSQAPFGTLSLSAGYRSASGGWQLAAWAKNLTDEKYLSAVSANTLGTFAWYAEPRTYGVTLSYSFGAAVESAAVEH